MKLTVVALDGPSASGKSSTGKAVAQALGFKHLDSGALYRAITLVAIGLREDDGLAIVGGCESRSLHLAPLGSEIVPYLDGEPVSDQIRSPAVTRDVSQVSALPEVRRWVTAELRLAVSKLGCGVVVDGRDIGTAVFPKAPLKIYLVAEPLVRARRRMRQGGRGESGPKDLTLEAERLRARDEADSSREVAPLRPAPDAVHIDTTHLAFQDQVARVVDLARKVLG